MTGVRVLLVDDGIAARVVVLLSTYDEDVGARCVAWCGAAAYVTKSALGPDRLRAVWDTASA